MEGLHGLLDGGVVVEPVALQDVDIVELKSGERRVD